MRIAIGAPALFEDGGVYCSVYTEAPERQHR